MELYLEEAARAANALAFDLQIVGPTVQKIFGHGGSEGMEQPASTLPGS